jgi:hypothetical protein
MSTEEEIPSFRAEFNGTPLAQKLGNAFIILDARELAKRIYDLSLERPDAAAFFSESFPEFLPSARQLRVFLSLVSFDTTAAPERGSRVDFGPLWRRENFVSPVKNQGFSLPQVPKTYRYLLHQLPQICSNASDRVSRKTEVAATLLHLMTLARPQRTYDRLAATAGVLRPNCVSGRKCSVHRPARAGARRRAQTQFRCGTYGCQRWLNLSALTYHVPFQAIVDVSYVEPASRR